MSSLFSLRYFISFVLPFAITFQTANASLKEGTSRVIEQLTPGPRPYESLAEKYQKTVMELESRMSTAYQNLRLQRDLTDVSEESLNVLRTLQAQFPNLANPMDYSIAVGYKSAPYRHNIGLPLSPDDLFLQYGQLNSYQQRELLAEALGEEHEYLISVLLLRKIAYLNYLTADAERMRNNSQLFTRQIEQFKTKVLTSVALTPLYYHKPTGNFENHAPNGFLFFLEDLTLPHRNLRIVSNTYSSQQDIIDSLYSRLRSQIGWNQFDFNRAVEQKKSELLLSHQTTYIVPDRLPPTVDRSAIISTPDYSNVPTDPFTRVSRTESLEKCMFYFVNGYRNADPESPIYTDFEAKRLCRGSSYVNYNFLDIQFTTCVQDKAAVDQWNQVDPIPTLALYARQCVEEVSAPL